MKLFFYNTMTRNTDEFVPLVPNEVGMYACGPTVYNYAHIGNLRTYIFEDILRRALEFAGYSVKHVMNITDVGHLTDDQDEGEDKMVKSSRETGKTVWEIADFYIQAFFSDTDRLNILRPTVSCRATEHIDTMIELIRRLEEKGHTYQAGGNVYFSIDSFPEYGRLGRLKLDDLREGARIDVDTQKKNPKDFVLWFTKSKFDNHIMEWDSPWGRGYPGWHIECSAMSMKYLGEQFDIHCGGTDHIQVHHTNEIAQSEAATGKKWVNYWMHAEFLIDDTGKMSKSKGDFLTLNLLTEKGYDPMDYRYFCLGGHYRSQLRFSFESLEAARKSRLNLYERIARLELEKEENESRNREERAGAAETDAAAFSDEIVISEAAEEVMNEFRTHLAQDLGMPRCLSVLWQAVKHKTLTPSEKLRLVYEMDSVLGLKLDEAASVTAGQTKQEELPLELKELIQEREEARKQKDYSRADTIRDILLQRGIELKDTPSGTEWTKKV